MNSNVIVLKQPATIASTVRVAPTEAKWIHQVNAKATDIAADWYKGPNSLRTRINSIDHSLTETLERYASLHQQHREKDYKEFHPKFPQMLYWPLLGVAVLLETPLNNSALGLMHMDNAETLMVAISIGVLNVLAASLVGWKVRQAKWNLAGIKDWLFVIAILAVSVGVMFGLAGLRMDDLIQHLKDADVGGPVSKSTFSTFVTLQMLFMTVGAFFSYSAHSDDPDLERIIKSKHHLRQRADQLLTQRSELASKHDRALGLAEMAISKLRSECLATITEYRDYNMATRTVLVPQWLQSALDNSVFIPVELGTALGTNPETLQQLIKRAEQSGNM